MRKFVCLLVAVAACLSACELKDDTKPEGNGNGEDGEDIPGQLMVSIAGTWVKESYNWDGGSETGDDMDHKVIILREDGTGVWEVDEDDYYADNIILSSMCMTVNQVS
ncbi:MAG: hypothetical protein NC115_01495 [Bacteroidales bacterium]|nr:hypothetical protein [Bacteroidales bacterium]